MPRLITKYELPPPSAQEKFTNLIQTILSVVLVIVALLAIVLFSYLPAKQNSPVLASAELSTTLPAAYPQASTRLAALSATFEQNEQEAKENPAIHDEFVTRIDTILQQLDTMDELVSKLNLSDKDKQSLLDNQQYQKDYWQAKRIFHETRLARLKSDTKVPQAQQPTKSVDQALKQVASTSVTDPVLPPIEATTDTEIKKAKPAVPANLPPDFCPLFGPNAGSCKAKAKNP